MQLVNGHTGGIHIADQWEADFAVATDLLGGIQIGGSGENDAQGIAFAERDQLGMRLILAGGFGGIWVVAQPVNSRDRNRPARAIRRDR